MNIEIPISDDFDRLQKMTLTDEYMDNNNFITMKFSNDLEVAFAVDICIDDLYFAIKTFREKAISDNTKVYSS